MSDKYLVNCAYGQDDPEKATIAFILAHASSKTHETAVFATAGASSLFLKETASGIHVEGYDPLDNLIDVYIENGGVVWLCPACAKAKGIVQDDLIEGVEIAGAPKTMAFLSSGGKTLA